MRDSKGFTIVELLIVIVVIGVLATITIIAYNGIQIRGENQKTISAVKEYIKAFNSYGLDNGDYPTVAGCLGEGYPAPNNRCLSQSGVADCWSLGGASSLVTTNALKPYMGGKAPEVSMQLARCGNTSYVGGYAWYDSTTKRVNIVMIQRGDQVCPAMSPNVISTTRGFIDDATRCTYIIGAI